MIMICGMLVISSLMVLSALYIHNRLPSESVSLVTISAVSAGVGIFILIFMAADLYDIQSDPPYFLDRNMLWLIGPCILIDAIGVMITILRVPTSSGIDMALVAFYFGYTLLGCYLFLKGRQLLRINYAVQIERRRLGKRSSVKKDDILKMAEEGNFSKICEILRGDVNFRNRELAAKVLVQSDDNSVIDDLLIGLSDEELCVRLASSISLTRFGRYEGREILEEVLKSGHEEDKVTVIEALRMIDQDWAIRLLEE